MKNYNMLKEKFVINTIEALIKEYDGVQRENVSGVRIAVKGPKDALINALIDRLASFKPNYKEYCSMISLEGGSRISIFNNDEFIDASRGLSSDVVILYGADKDELYHSSYLMAYKSLNKLIVV